MRSCNKCKLTNAIDDNSTPTQALQDPKKVKKIIVVLLHCLAGPGDLEPVKNKLTADLQSKKCASDSAQ